MKKTILLAALVSAAMMAAAQQQVTLYDSSQGVVTYRLGGVPVQEVADAALEVTYRCTMLKRPVSSPERTSEDFLVLLAGEGVTKCFSYKTFQADSLIACSTADQVLANIGSFRGGETWVVFTNWPQGKITCTDKVSNDYYRYEEDMPRIEWVADTLTRQVAGYTCQRATGRFRGREWEVWFAPEIPVAAGPWKLGGLPGLILAARDSEGHYLFEAAGIRAVRQPITCDERKYMKLTREKFLELQRRFYKDPLGYMKANSGVTVRVLNPDGSPRTDQPVEMEFNPLERS